MSLATSRKERLRAVIHVLNSIGVGDISGIEAKLEAARQDLQALGETELEDTLAEARGRLRDGIVTEFRRLIAQTVSRLGHVR